MKTIKRTVFFVSLIILQGCNNIEHKVGEQEKNILIFSPDLNDKYYDEKLCCLVPVERTSDSYLGIQTYSGFLVTEKELDERSDSFIYSDEIYQYSQCALFDDILYVKIDNGCSMTHESILLKIEMNKYEIIRIFSSDIEFYVFTPQKSTLRTSLNEFHVGDTIVGEISLSYKDSVSFNYYDRKFLVGFEWDGHFMGVINQGTVEWKEMLHTHSGGRFFQDK